MSIVNICGFETGDSAEVFQVLNGTASIQSSITRGSWSAYALRVNPLTTANGYARLGYLLTTGVVTAGGTGFVDSYYRFYFRCDTKPASATEDMLAVANVGGSVKLRLKLKSTGVIEVYNALTALVATGTTVLSNGIWYRIELLVGTGNPASWALKIDGNSEVSGSDNISTSNNGSIFLGKVNNTNSQSLDFYYDDFSWSDSAYPGEGKVTCLLPNGVGNYQTWTIGAGSGSNWQVVDERPPNSDTDYLISTTNTGDAETEALTDISTAGVSGTIHAVKAIAVLRSNGVSSTVKVRLRSGGTDSDTSAAATLQSIYSSVANVFNTDPNTSSAWNASSLNSIEAGAVTANTSQTRMTFTGAMIDFIESGSAPVAHNFVAKRYQSFGLGGILH